MLPEGDGGLSEDPYRNELAGFIRPRRCRPMCDVRDKPGSLGASSCGWVVCLVLALASRGVGAPEPEAPRSRPGVGSSGADLVIHNAKVITVDPAFAIAEAVAIRGDRI